MGSGLELEEFLAQLSGVDDEGAVGWCAFGKGVGEHVVVRGRLGGCGERSG